MTDPSASLRAIPQIDALWSDLRADSRIRGLPDALVRQALREIVAAVRDAWRRSSGPPPLYFESREFVDDVVARVSASLRRRHEAVVNATGILLHTGLGRAPLSDAAIDAVAGAGRYAIVEVDPDSGERDFREARCAALLARLTGAEAATVVNNNAAATLLVLSALGGGRAGIASRGELVEIGGGFRMPDVMAASGCRLIEVGTTNRTYAKDYERALTDDVALLLKIHTSNFRILGFTHAPAIEELARVAASRGLPLVHDLGSGLLRPIAVAPLHDEPTVRGSIGEGADVVCFSGDKLLCGPQAGIVVGKKRYLDVIRAHPLFRAMRPGKLDLAALEATLLAYLVEPDGIPDLPLYRQLALTLDQLSARAERLRAELSRIGGAVASTVDCVGFLGSGSAPAREIESVAVELRVAGLAAAELASRLRRATPRIYTRVVHDAVVFDLRTIFEDQIASLVSVVLASCVQSGGASPNPKSSS